MSPAVCRARVVGVVSAVRAAVLGVAMLAPATGLAAEPAAEPKQPVPLIDREVLFGNPQRAALRISPDGQYLSWLAPLDGVLNVWVAPVGQPDNARAVTRDTGRGISSYFWSYTPGKLLYLQDEGGNENDNVFVVDVQSGEAKNLVSNPAVAAQISGVSDAFPETIVVGLNDRTPMFHDLWKVNILTGEKTLLMQHPGMINGNVVAGMAVDEAYTVRFASAFLPDGGIQMYMPDAEGGWAAYETIGFEDTMTTGGRGFDDAGRILYMADSRGRDTAALVAVDLETGDRTQLAEHPQADVGTVLMSQDEGTPQAVVFDHLKPEWTVLDPALTDDFAYLKENLDGEINITSRTRDERLWTVAAVPDDGPVSYYLYDSQANRATFLFVNRPELAELPLVKMQPVVIPARDGLELVSYYSLPLAADENQDGTAERPAPMVLLVHGGPWARDTWGYNPLHQWLANRGYAVLSVNFRGSTGFGKAFVNAGNKEWAGKMHDDLIDAVDWAVQQGITTEDRVGIMGGSYGGYATLVGLTFTPDVFACGVDIVGPSSIITLLETIPPYWAPAKVLFHTRVGDPTTDDGRAFLESRSPLNFVERIEKPLLIGQGANDPRVKQSESDQIVAAMQQANIPVTYVLYPDEGHGFARPENRLSFFGVAEAFLAEHLGGRYDPLSEGDFAGSSIQVPAGAEHVPGLQPAIDGK